MKSQPTPTEQERMFEQRPVVSSSLTPEISRSVVAKQRRTTQAYVLSVSVKRNTRAARSEFLSLFSCGKPSEASLFFPDFSDSPCWSGFCCLFCFVLSIAVAPTTKQSCWFGRKPTLNLFKHVQRFCSSAGKTSTQIPKLTPISRDHAPRLSGPVAPPPPPFGWQPFSFVCSDILVYRSVSECASQSTNQEPG